MNNFSKVIKQAGLLFLVSIVVNALYSPPEISSALDIVNWLISFGVSQLLFQIFAYITCLFLVIKKAKGENAIWINYIVWIFIANFGFVSELVGYV